MLMRVLTKIFGTQHAREMKKVQPLVEEINKWEKKMKKLSSSEFSSRSASFRERIDQGESLDGLLPETFALCREASWRVIGMRHYDVQLIGGIILHRGAIAEMKTGEGKTLVATLPLYLNALTGKGAHLVTVNDYLASRDEEWMGPIYHFLGLSTGTITHDLSDVERKKAYSADITYGTNNEFGFDYLRDNMKFHIKDFTQKSFHYAIVDECDSILIDEARTPLIISGPSQESTNKYHEVNKIIPHLKKDLHFTVEEKTRTVSLTEEGNEKVEELLGVKNLYDIQNIQWLHHIYQGLKAHHLFKKDFDYMLKDGEVIIIDEFTGRLMPGRRWSEGIHQAIEAKEKVKVKSENQTLATVTFQNYFRMYEKLSGMTGTAETEAVEFKKIYNLGVTVIPTHEQVIRQDQEDVVYKTEKAKFRAIAEDIRERNETGQPVLVGTISIERSEALSRMLKKEGIFHHILNAKHHEREAEIIAQAGRKASVTIATNMAGRGTDIQLGGNPEALALRDLQKKIKEDSWKTSHWMSSSHQSHKRSKKGRSKKGRSEESEDSSLTKEEKQEKRQKEEEKEKEEQEFLRKEFYQKSLKAYKETCDQEKKAVIERGGLYIIGTERHESRRIDNQLRGRSGRQGDPGETRFYLSLEDDLMRIFNGERIQKIMNTLKMPEDEPITAGLVTRAIEGAQKKVEGHQFDIRKHLLEYDNVMNQQRQNIYSLRRSILQGDDMERAMLDMLGDVVSSVVDQFANEKVKEEDWDIQGLVSYLSQQFGVDLNFDLQLQVPHHEWITKVRDVVKEKYEAQKQKLGSQLPSIQKIILLQTIDHHWKEYLAFNDHIKEGINLRAYAQRDPLIEYKKEAFHAFENMNFALRRESIEKFFKIHIVSGALEEAEQEEVVDSLGSVELDYHGGRELDLGEVYRDFSTEFKKGTQEQRAKNLLSQYQDSLLKEQRENVLGRGEGEEVKLNRAERRRRLKAGKKRQRRR